MSIGTPASTTIVVYLAGGEKTVRSVNEALPHLAEQYARARQAGATKVMEYVDLGRSIAAVYGAMRGAKSMRSFIRQRGMHMTTCKRALYLARKHSTGELRAALEAVIAQTSEQDHNKVVPRADPLCTEYGGVSVRMAEQACRDADRLQRPMRIRTFAEIEAESMAEWEANEAKKRKRRSMQSTNDHASFQPAYQPADDGDGLVGASGSQRSMAELYAQCHRHMQQVGLRITDESIAIHKRERARTILEHAMSEAEAAMA